MLPAATSQALPLAFGCRMSEKGPVPACDPARRKMAISEIAFTWSVPADGLIDPFE